MTPLQIKQVAAEIASRIPAMAQDCATNNAVVIEGMLKEFKRRASEPPKGVKVLRCDCVYFKQHFAITFDDQDMRECGWTEHCPFCKKPFPTT